MELIITNRKKQKFVVLYDDCDHELISKYTWHIASVKIPYVRTTIRMNNGKFTSIRMHRLILDIVGTEYFGDHINHNILDIGRYDNEIDAAKAYDAKAREIHGEFANLNFPQIKII